MSESLYVYFDVEEAVFSNFLSTLSKRRFLNKYIRGKFGYRRICDWYINEEVDGEVYEDVHEDVGSETHDRTNEKMNSDESYHSSDNRGGSAHNWSNYFTQLDDSLASDFRTLGLLPSASNKDVRFQFRKLVKQYHPDALAGRIQSHKQCALAHHRMVVINESYQRIKAHRRM